jgi:alpha-D-ribose 1-methylphosphonate 5-triphosphate synthase subunit PhnI
MAAQDTTRQALSFGMGRELKVVYLLRGYKGFLAPVDDNYRRRGMNIKNAKARERDRGLFDMAMSLC